MSVYRTIGPLVYRTEHNYSVFCNQKQGSTKNVNAYLSGNLYGATYFFFARLAHPVYKTLIKNVVLYCTSTNPYITQFPKQKQQHFIITFTPEVTFFLK